MLKALVFIVFILESASNLSWAQSCKKLTKTISSNSLQLAKIDFDLFIGIENKISEQSYKSAIQQGITFEIFGTLLIVRRYLREIARVEMKSEIEFLQVHNDDFTNEAGTVTGRHATYLAIKGSDKDDLLLFEIATNSILIEIENHKVQSWFESQLK